MNATIGMTSPAPLSNAPLGEVTVSDDTLQIVFHRHLRAPVEKVWAALTTPERLADWFANAEIDLRVGGILRLDGECQGQGRLHEFASRLCHGYFLAGLTIVERRARAGLLVLAKYQSFPV